MERISPPMNIAVRNTAKSQVRPRPEQENTIATRTGIDPGMTDKYSSGMKTVTSLTKDVLHLNNARYQLRNDQTNKLNSEVQRQERNRALYPEVAADRIAK